MALDDLDERFATAVKLALGTSPTSGGDQSDAGLECPSSDMIAAYYECALNRVERARLEAHFSGCARCQGTLAALLRTAPAVDTSTEAGGSAAAAARRAAAESAGIRERWFEIRPAWRTAGVTAAATAILAVVVVAAVHVYQGRFGQESEQVAALISAPAGHHRQPSHPALGGSNSNSFSGAEIALNDKKSANKSAIPAAPAEPRAANAPSAAAGAPGASSTAPAGVSGEPGAPAEEIAPPHAEQNEAAPESAAQAAAALGALAVTPAPAAAPAHSTSAAPSVAAAPSAAAPSVAAPAAAASVAAAAPPASEGASPAAAPAAPVTLSEKPQQLAKLSKAPPPRLQQFAAVTQGPAKASQPTLAERLSPSGERE